MTWPNCLFAFKTRARALACPLDRSITTSNKRGVATLSHCLQTRRIAEVEIWERNLAAKVLENERATVFAWTALAFACSPGEKEPDKNIGLTFSSLLFTQIFWCLYQEQSGEAQALLRRARQHAGFWFEVPEHGDDLAHAAGTSNNPKKRRTKRKRRNPRSNSVDHSRDGSVAPKKSRERSLEHVHSASADCMIEESPTARELGAPATPAGWDTDSTLTSLPSSDESDSEVSVQLASFLTSKVPPIMSTSRPKRAATNHENITPLATMKFKYHRNGRRESSIDLADYIPSALISADRKGRRSKRPRLSKPVEVGPGSLTTELSSIDTSRRENTTDDLVAPAETVSSTTAQQIRSVSISSKEKDALATGNPKISNAKKAYKVREKKVTARERRSAVLANKDTAVSRSGIISSHPSVSLGSRGTRNNRDRTAQEDVLSSVAPIDLCPSPGRTGPRLSTGLPGASGRSQQTSTKGMRSEGSRPRTVAKQIVSGRAAKSKSSARRSRYDSETPSVAVDETRPIVKIRPTGLPARKGAGPKCVARRSKYHSETSSVADDEMRPIVKVKRTGLRARMSPAVSGKTADAKVRAISGGSQKGSQRNARSNEASTERSVVQVSSPQAGVPEDSLWLPQTDTQASSARRLGSPLLLDGHVDGSISSGSTLVIPKATLHLPRTSSSQLHPISALVDSTTFNPPLDPAETVSRLRSRLRPPLPCTPPVWAKHRQEVCETVEWFRSYQGGVYFNKNYAHGYLLSAFSASRDIFHHQGKLIISHGGGRAEALHTKEGRTSTTQASDQHADDLSVRALLLSYEQRHPVVLLIDDKYELFPYDLHATNPDYTYVALGNYLITRVWAERCIPKNSSESVIRYKFAFQWCDEQGDPWWLKQRLMQTDSTTEESSSTAATKNDSYSRGQCSGSISDESFAAPLDYDSAGIIRRICRFCGNESPLIYEQGWVCTQPYCHMFWMLDDGKHPHDELTYAQSFLGLLDLPSMGCRDIRPPLPVGPHSDQITTTLEFTRGYHCRTCGRLSCRVKWQYWQCSNCGGIYHVPGRTRLPNELRIRMKLGFDRHKVSSISGIVKPPFCLYTENRYYGYSQIFILPDGRGRIHHILGSPLLNTRANDIFRKYQDQAAEGRVSFRRWPIRMHKCRGDLLAQYFSHNAGAPYHYVGGTNETVPFQEAPSAVMEALDLIQDRASKAVRRLLRFNEILSAAYMQDQQMAYHGDDEEGLGPVVASLSLGSPALMRFRPKGQKQDILSIILHHGDVLVMEGLEVQQYYEHQVQPADFRIAATARQIGVLEGL